MAFRWSLLVAPVAFAAAIQMSSAAPQLHWPLPEDSTAVNGVMPTPHEHITHLKFNPALVKPLPDVGLHPRAAQGLKRIYRGSPVTVTNYHNDNYPTGWNQSETDLTPATVGSASFGQITSLAADGNVMAQPLIVSNFTMPDSSVRNVLIVATGHNTVYAYDAQTYAILWQVSLGKPQKTQDVGCFDIKPEYGISSTPVIVRTAANAATIYVVSATEPKHLSFHTQLHALDLGTGQDVHKPKEIAPQAKLATGGVMHFDPQHQWNRAALAYNNGAIYVGVGSHCDANAGNISGWVLRYDASTFKLTNAFNTIEAAAGYELSSIWMAGYAPAISPDGHVYAITGNGNYSLKKGAKGYGESVLGLTSDLSKKVDTFTPADFDDLNNSDADFGSGGAMLIPSAAGQTAPPMIVGEGKAGEIFVLDSTHLGGLQSKHSQPLQTLDGGGCWCGPAYYNGPTGGVVFYQGGGDVLRAYSVNPTATTAPYLTNTVSGDSGATGSGSFPVVSSNGTTAHTGIVWLIQRADTEHLEAYNAESLGAPIFQGNAGTWSNDASRAYLSPLVANGRVYVGSKNAVTVFGLTE